MIRSYFCHPAVVIVAPFHNSKFIHTWALQLLMQLKRMYTLKFLFPGYYIILLVLWARTNMANIYEWSRILDFFIKIFKGHWCGRSIRAIECPREGVPLRFEKNLLFLSLWVQYLIFVPASYILYLSDFCRFLLCTCGWERRGWRRGGG
jgi:hypothetical protein